METEPETFETDKTLQAIKQRLTADFFPSRMFLFGSRAGGTHRSDSDYDILLVVKETKFSRKENMDRARELVSDLRISADIFVYSDQEFEDWKNELNSVAEAAHNLGVEIPLG